jgi:macrolide-specific efflux system membrane fusion protein
VRQVLPTPELISSVVFYDVLFDIPNPGRELKIQMTAQVFIVLAEAKGVLLIPAAVVAGAAEHSQTTVQVMKADGSLERRAIRIGIKSELFAEVQGGLQENERIVLRSMPVKGAGAKSALSAGAGH